MELAVGEIVEGKVTGITKFGAFVALDGGKTGMVHISEIAHAYVSDINEYLTIGQMVKAKIIAVDPAGKIKLSIKMTTEPPARTQRDGGRERTGRGSSGGARRSAGGGHPAAQRPAAQSKEPQSFDDMLKRFMADSDSKISSIKAYSDHRTKGKRRQ